MADGGRTEGAAVQMYAGKALAGQDVAPRTIIKLNEDGSLSVSAGLGKCAGCGRVAGFFTNRGGVSLCSSECAPKAVAK